jgi:hypothetical protein
MERKAIFLFVICFAAAEDDPLPAIEGLRITGEAFPGRELQASGYSINGTTSCNFEVSTLPLLFCYLYSWEGIYR